MTSRRNILIGAAACEAAIMTTATAKAQMTQAVGSNDLAGKRALVTGASRGIGAGIALALADKGADVVFIYLILKSKPANQLTPRLALHGGRWFPH